MVFIAWGGFCFYFVFVFTSHMGKHVRINGSGKAPSYWRYSVYRFYWEVRRILCACTILSELCNLNNRKPVNKPHWSKSESFCNWNKVTIYSNESSVHVYVITPTRRERRVFKVLKEYTQAIVATFVNFTSKLHL